MPLPIRYANAAVPGLVSIVVPCHNSARLLGQTLDSISSQWYDNWELWVVEDGTRDGAERIVAEFAARRPGRRVEYRRNDTCRGPSYARNVAFHEVDGEYVALVDSDDRWMPDHLATAVETLQSRRLDVVYSTVVMFEDQTDRLIGVLGPSEDEERNFERSMFGRNLVVPSATVIRRDVLADVGEWETSLRYCEDYEYWMRALVAGKRFGHVGGVHCMYRKGHGEAATKNMARLLTAFANVADSFLDAPLPNAPLNARRKIVADGYRWAAIAHWRGDRDHDPSVDPSQSPGLNLRSWQLRPKRWKLLARWAWQSLSPRGRRKATSQPADAPAAASPAPPLRTAA